MARIFSHRNSADRVEPSARLPSRERLIVWGSILAVTAFSWLVLARIALTQHAINRGMISSMNAGGVPWSLRDAWFIFAMWTMMMAAMMLPSASPMIEMYVRMARGRSTERVGHAGFFAIGYLIAWTGFSAAITAVQYALERTGIVGGAMRVGPFAGGLLLIATGIYQVTPFKQACLTQCRSPLGYFMTEWRSGQRGALEMGLNHGVFCVGCCWLLMTLMFVAGAMNLLWAAALTLFVLLEKAAPWGDTVARASGMVMVASGIALAAFG